RAQAVQGRAGPPAPAGSPPAYGADTGPPPGCALRADTPASPPRTPPASAPSSSSLHHGGTADDGAALTTAGDRVHALGAERTQPDPRPPAAGERHRRAGDARRGSRIPEQPGPASNRPCRPQNGRGAHRGPGRKTAG